MQECLRILFCENSRYILLHQRILVVSKVSTMTITTTPDLCFMLWEGYGSITTLHHLVVVVLIQKKKKKKKVFDLCVEIKKEQSKPQTIVVFCATLIWIDCLDAPCRRRCRSSASSFTVTTTTSSSSTTKL